MLFLNLDVKIWTLETLLASQLTKMRHIRATSLASSLLTFGLKDLTGTGGTSGEQMGVWQVPGE